MLKTIDTLVDIVPVSDRRNADWAPALAGEQLLFSRALGEAAGRVLGRLVSNGDDGVTNCLVLGGSGSGKTTFLAILTSVLASRAGEPLHPRLEQLRTLLRGRATV